MVACMLLLLAVSLVLSSAQSDAEARLRRQAAAVRLHSSTWHELPAEQSLALTQSRRCIAVREPDVLVSILRCA